ncbi:MAG: hypothetical protein KatS3mg103_0866 [Phycisphaerales bacterium]|nr:MAG: hypothetical protein KatS3mg103_0866 [Phycisphaerales bacterium]
MGDRSDIERVLSATDIVRVVRARVELRQKGREWVGLCPFHDDRSPSMYVSPGKQIFKCFACGAGGDALTFVQKYDGVGFVEALEHLAELSGVTLEDRRQGRALAERGGSGRSRRAQALEANALAQRFYRQCLEDVQLGAQARAMIERRGISPEMVEAFGLGAAPDGWDHLVRAARASGLAIEALELASLARQRANGQGHFDVFRHRLMFPIHDQGGRVIGFGGRRLSEDDPAKYLNSPESVVFRKSSVLYGLWRAAGGIRKAGWCLVTEGYTDTIACHQAGLSNTVATLGTAFTTEHARLLRRLCERVVLLFDGDEAGLRAADRAVGVLFAGPLDVQIAVLDGSDGAKDPDELLAQADGRQRFEALLAGAKDLLSYRFQRLRSALAGKGRSALLSAIEEEVRWLGEHGLGEVEPARQDRIFAQLGDLSGLDQVHLRRLALSARRPGRAVRPVSGDSGQRPGPGAAGGPVGDPAGDARVGGGSAPLSAADKLVGLVLHEPAAWGLLSEDDVTALREALAGGPSDPVAAAIDRLAAEGEPISMAALRAELDESAIQRASTLAAWAERQWAQVDLGSTAQTGDDAGRALGQAVAGLLRAVVSRQAQVSIDPLERIAARKSQLARFERDPGRIARPT